MRTVDSHNQTAQDSTAVKYRHSAIARREVLNFATFTSQSIGTADTSLPSTIEGAFVTWRTTDGKAWVKGGFAPGTAGSWALSSTGSTQIDGAGAATQYHCLRYGIMPGTSHLFAAIHDASGIKVRRLALSGSPPTLTQQAETSYFGPVFRDGTAGDYVCRVEAVCPYSDDDAIVAVGVHDYAAHRSTINFYYVSLASGWSYLLNTIIQAEFTTAYSAGVTYWYNVAKWATCVHAFVNTTTGKLIVVANESAAGRAVLFSLYNAVESDVRPVVPFDTEAATLSFVAYSSVLINGLYYMAGRWSRTHGEGANAQTTAFDLYLTSDDGESWSFMASNCALQDAPSSGTIIYVTGTPAYLYYGGYGVACRAKATPLQDPASTDALDITDYLAGHTLDEVTNAADKAEFTLSGSPSDVDALRASLHLAGGSVIRLKSGQSGYLSDIGAYGIDIPEHSDDAESGAEAPRISTRELGSKTMIEHRMPLSMTFDGLAELRDDLTKADAFTAITNNDAERVTFTDGDHLKYADLHTPAVWIAEGDDQGNLFARARVLVSSHDTAHVSVFAFLFGCSDDGLTGNMVCFVKGQTTAWTGHAPVKVSVRTIKLNPVDDTDPDKEDTGWTLKARAHGLLEARETAQIVSEAAGGSYFTQPDFVMTPGGEYDLVVRKSSSRVQAWAKPRVMAPATIADNAAFTLVMDFQFDKTAQHAQYGRDFCGLALSTDVYSNEAFSAGVAADLEVQITEAANTQVYSVLLGNGWTDSPSPDPGRVQNFNPCASGLHIGQVVRITGANGDHTYTITGMDCGATPWLQTSGTFTYVGRADYYVYGAANAVTWGWADSAYRTMDIAAPGGSVAVQIDPKAKKRKYKWGGRGAFVADTDVMSIRSVMTDGERTLLYSGSHAGTLTEQGWDTTTPVGSQGNWRLILPPNKIADGRPSDYGLPEGSLSKQYFMAEREIFGYELLEMAQSGQGNTAVTRWLYCPTFFAACKAQAEGLSTVTQWSSGGDMPGDDVGAIPSPAGMLFEITGRTGDEYDDAEEEIYRVASVTQRAPASGGSYVTLDKALPVALKDSATSTTDAGHMMTISRRAMFYVKGSKLLSGKTTHDSKVPVVYCPVDASGSLAYIQVKQFNVWSGRMQTVRDCIERVCASAGLHNVRFRSALTTPAWSFTPTTSPQSLPLRETLANFCLDGRFHIVGGSTNSGGVQTGDNRLDITFRGYYRLSIQQWDTGADIAAGNAGKVRLMLSTTNVNANAASTADPTDVKLATNGDYGFLEIAVVPVCKPNLGGTFALVSGVQYTYTDTPTRLTRVRITAEGPKVVVEMNGCLVWVFDLAALNDGAGSDYYVETAGAIAAKYTGSIGAHTAYADVDELHASVDRHAVSAGAQASSAVQSLESGRYIRWRATQDGGVEFGRDLHDSLGTVQENTWRFAWRREDAAAVNHVLVSGRDKISGEYYDAADIGSNGHKFASNQNDTVTTVEEATRIARYEVTEAREAATTGELSGVARIEMQPEDYFTLVYDPGTDAPARAAEDWIVTSIRTAANAEDGTLEMSAQVRKKVA